MHDCSGNQKQRWVSTLIEIAKTHTILMVSQFSVQEQRIGIRPLRQRRWQLQMLNQQNFKRPVFGEIPEQQNELQLPNRIRLACFKRFWLFPKVMCNWVVYHNRPPKREQNLFKRLVFLKTGTYRVGSYIWVAFRGILPVLWPYKAYWFSVNDTSL